MRLALIIGLGLIAAGTAPAIAAPARQAHTVIVKKTVAPDGTVKTEVEGDAQAKAMVAACSDRKFEATAEIADGAQKRVSKIKLCAKPGEDDAAWLKALEQARAKIGEMDQLAPDSRAKIVADLDAEIARMRDSLAAKPKP
ncbi:MAG: hypothetical protein LC656_11650 [Sphingomonadales bacterium]|nr:hypothetical protein [Sphingomonadales bacterium]